MLESRQACKSTGAAACRPPTATDPGCSCAQSDKPVIHRDRFGGTLLFAVSCAISPCCTPLYLPLVLAALAGTPLALWLGANLGWVYGVLSVASVVSLGFALRKWNAREATA